MTSLSVSPELLTNTSIVYSLYLTWQNYYYRKRNTEILKICSSIASAAKKNPALYHHSSNIDILRFYKRGWHSLGWQPDSSWSSAAANQAANQAATDSRTAYWTATNWTATHWTDTYWTTTYWTTTTHWTTTHWTASCSTTAGVTSTQWSVTSSKACSMSYDRKSKRHFEGMLNRVSMLARPLIGKEVSRNNFLVCIRTSIM